MNTSCEFISEPPMVEKAEEKKSKNEEGKNETILPGTGVSCKSGTFSLITYYIPLYHVLVTGHPYHIRTPR